MIARLDPTFFRTALLASAVLIALTARAQVEDGTAEPIKIEAATTEDNVTEDESTEDSKSTKSVLQSDSATSSKGVPTSIERRLFRIFKNSAPVSNEKWSTIVGDRRQEIYTVQSGDTLWDISQTLFGDGFFWSKLWAENGKLENPHEISPNQQIQLMAGTEANAPAISVGQASSSEGGMLEDVSQSIAEDSAANHGGSKVASNGAKVPVPSHRHGGPVYREQALQNLTPEELASGQTIEVDELVPEPQLPPAKSRRPVLKKLPASFVTEVAPKEGEYDSTGLDANKMKSLTIPATIVPNSFLADHSVENVGKVVEIETQEKVASVGQNIFLRLDGKARIGERFSILFPKDKIAISSIKSLGPIVEIGGRVQVVDVINEDRNIYRAIVVQAVNPIRLNSLVSRESLPIATYSRRGTRTTIRSTIIGGEYSETRKLFGEGAVVYVDQGRQAGLNTGDILPIQSRRSVRREGTTFPDWDQAIGLLKLVKVEDSVATGIILEARAEVFVGDRTGGRLTPNVYVPEEYNQTKSE